MPRIDNDIKLDFKDVLVRPKRSTLRSRSDVSWRLVWARWLGETASRSGTLFVVRRSFQCQCRLLRGCMSLSCTVLCTVRNSLFFVFKLDFLFLQSLSTRPLFGTRAAERHSWSTRLKPYRGESSSSNFSDHHQSVLTVLSQQGLSFVACCQCALLSVQITRLVTLPYYYIYCTEVHVYCI